MGTTARGRRLARHLPGQAIYKRVEGAEWETMYYNFVELHEAVKGKKSGGNKKVGRSGL